jgi:predicted KAP-like P-loop ATPase
MWSDNETDVDLLDFDYLVSGITSIVGNETLLPATIGVYGDWGSGKSSLLKRTQTELEKDKDVLVLSFTGWLFEGYEDAKTALMGTILDEIVAKRTLSYKAKHLIRNLSKRINVMQVLGSMTKFGVKAGLAYATGGIAGLSLSSTLDVANITERVLEKAREVDVDEVELDKFIKEDPQQNLRRGIREFRKDFEKLLEETKIKTLVIIIDDLDRCNPDTIIETLEAIKLFLFVPHTAFILGADERLVKYAVRRRFPELPGERAEVGRDYLEKLIQSHQG